MQITVEGRNVPVHETLWERVEKDLNSALGRFHSRIASVSAMFEDINGPRGGIDKYCRITVKLDRSGVIYVDATDVDFFSALSSAADRAARVVQRKLERRRTIRHAAARWANHDPDDLDDGEPSEIQEPPELQQPERP